MVDRVLLGDIGGTNARFALADGEGIGRLGECLHLEVAAFATARAAIVQALEELAGDRRPQALALACAGPVEKGKVALTNSTWTLDAAALRRDTGVSEVHLVNDFAAQAWALPVLTGDDLIPIGDASPEAGRPAVVLGPGTGLGIAAYLPTAQGPQVVVGEGGHGTMPAADDREAAVLAALRRRDGHVSAEHVLSGDGLVRLYEIIAELEGRKTALRSAAEISAAAADGSSADCRAAVDMFCALLGTLAGNLALTFGARGGVYIAGGIVPHMRARLQTSEFRSRFVAKGRLRDYLAPIPTWLVTHRQPAFVGLLHALETLNRTAAAPARARPDRSG